MEGRIVVCLEEIADHLEDTFEGWQQYLNIQTGMIVAVQNEHMAIAEDLESEEDLSGYQDWEREAIQAAIHVLEQWDFYYVLPSPKDFDEYRMMESFAIGVSNQRKGAMLLAALNGKGTFRRFKDALVRANLEQKWYDYRYQSFLLLAQDWCESKDVAFTRKKP